MYGDEFGHTPPKKEKDKTKVPASNREICNPLFRIHKSEWVADKIERSTKSIKDEQNKPKTPIHERESKIKFIKEKSSLKK